MESAIRLAVCAAWIAFSSGAALAGEGVLEINQTCASAGCFPGDTPGFPVTIANRGSYVLTGDLMLTVAAGSAVNAIEVRSDDVTLDLNVFSIHCVRTVLPAGPCKGQSGTGDAVEIASGHNVRIANGTVRDFAQHGINGADTTSYVLDGIRAVNNGIDSSGGAQILRPHAVDNAQYGILIRTGSALVLDAYTSLNGAGGIRDLTGDEAIVRSFFRDGTNAVTAADLVDCIFDGITGVCP